MSYEQPPSGAPYPPPPGSYSPQGSYGSPEGYPPAYPPQPEGYPPQGVYPPQPQGYAGMYQPGYYQGPMAPSTSGYAIASLVCAILGWVGFPVIGSIAGAIFGHIALNEIRRSEGRLQGHGLALAGLIISYATLALLVLAVVVVIFVLVSIPHSAPTY